MTLLFLAMPISLEFSKFGLVRYIYIDNNYYISNDFPKVGDF